MINVTSNGMEKMVFELLIFGLKNQNPRNIDFFGFMVFWDIIFSYKFCAQTTYGAWLDFAGGGPGPTLRIDHH